MKGSRKEEDMNGEKGRRGRKRRRKKMGEWMGKREKKVAKKGEEKREV
jgi:hypothetical protein